MLLFDEATFDHEPPLGEGGNLRQGVIACWDCNQRRSHEQQSRAKKQKLLERVEIPKEAATFIL